ncbi:hypothetical protein ASD40_04085 [Paenibacillus sp. Root444D2]|nr:hypothetical protein ASD40_04085 [Paenibacillus sp. Root444D2]KRE45921.1 hypothetical protein ASG85_30665 [Paenibacillus sp. Soil724D2]
MLTSSYYPSYDVMNELDECDDHTQRVVWSEIGYAGPAYPRGYVRTQLGQLDPWEAQPKQ